MVDVQSAAELAAIPIWPLVGALFAHLVSSWPRRGRRAAAS